MIICWRIRSVLILIWVGLFSGCTMPPPPPVSHSSVCASFTESHWEEFTYGVDTPDDVITTAVHLWEIEREHVQFMLKTSGEIHRTRWRSSTVIGIGGVYEASFRDGLLRKINVRWGSLSRPSLSQIIDCLGSPDHYIAFYHMSIEAPLLSLALLYTDSGTVVHHLAPSMSAELSRIHPDMRMSRFVVVPPGTAEQMITDMYSYGSVDPDHVHSVCLIKPWPGSIEAMEIASDEERFQCGL